jgi:DNA-binding NarL/FixJ family response regulator
MSLVKLLILAEERLLGLGLASLLNRWYETHTAESLERALAETRDDTDVALWLGERLDAGAVAKLAELEAAHPGIRLCVLAWDADPEALGSLLGRDHVAIAVLIRSGELDVAHVCDCMDAILDGHSRLEPSVLARMVDSYRSAQDALAELTAPEEEVLELVACGLRNREIARRVWKSEKAVEKRVSAVFEKLGLGRESADLDRRVAAARIFFSCRPESVASGDESVRGQTEQIAPAVGPHF